MVGGGSFNARCVAQRARLCGSETELLFCGTATTGNCSSATSPSIPPGSERLVIESSSFGTVPATRAYVGFDITCKAVP